MLLRKFIIDFVVWSYNGEDVCSLLHFPFDGCILGDLITPRDPSHLGGLDRRVLSWVFLLLAPRSADTLAMLRFLWLFLCVAPIANGYSLFKALDGITAVIIGVSSSSGFSTYLSPIIMSIGWPWNLCRYNNKVIKGCYAPHGTVAPELMFPQLTCAASHWGL